MKIEKRNHKGFTLVELLIAVVILAVVVIPLINNFVLSAKINQKSKKVMNGTSMMQNVMEGMNAYAVEDIVKSFERHSAVSSNSLSFFPNGMTVSNYGELDTAGTTVQFAGPVVNVLYAVVTFVGTFVSVLPLPGINIFAPSTFAIYILNV